MGTTTPLPLSHHFHPSTHLPSINGLPPSNRERAECSLHPASGLIAGVLRVSSPSSTACNSPHPRPLPCPVPCKGSKLASCPRQFARLAPLIVLFILPHSARHYPTRRFHQISPMTTVIPSMVPFHLDLTSSAAIAPIHTSITRLLDRRHTSRRWTCSPRSAHVHPSPGRPRHATPAGVERFDATLAARPP